MKVYLDQVVAFMKSHWGAILAFLLALWTQFSPVVLDYVHNHPKLSTVYAVVAFTIAYYWKRQSQTYYYQKGVAMANFKEIPKSPAIAPKTT